MRRPIVLAGAVLLALGAVACGGDDEGSTAPVETDAPLDSPAPEPVDETPAGDVGEIIELTFDGDECTAAGPIEIPPGDAAFVLTDESDLKGELFIRQLLDGRTFQDMVDAQEEAGGPGFYWARPEWVISVMWDVDPPEIELADDQQLLTAVLEPGEPYALGVFSTEGRAEARSGIWLCAPVDVLDS